MKTLKLLILASLPFFLTSCLVTRKKYDIAEAGRLAAIFSRDSVEDLLAEKRVSYDALEKLYNGLKVDTAQLRDGIRNYQTLLNANKSERDQLSNQLNSKLKELSEREETIRQLRGVIDEQNAQPLHSNRSLPFSGA